MSENEEIADLKRQLAMVTDELNQVKSQQYDAAKQPKSKEAEQKSPQERAWEVYDESVKKGEPKDTAGAKYVNALFKGKAAQAREEEEDRLLSRTEERLKKARGEDGGEDEGDDS